MWKDQRHGRWNQMVELVSAAEKLPELKIEDRVLILEERLDEIEEAVIFLEKSLGKYKSTITTLKLKVFKLVREKK